jgi:membrane-associated phospholipid phosphatase
VQPLDRVWLWYLLTMLAAVGLFGFGPGPQHHRPWLYLAVASAMVVGQLALARHPRAWVARGAYAAVGLPIVYSSVGLVLPHLHPEPYEFHFIAADRALFGTDPTVALEPWLAPWWTELLYWCYASFYFLPVIVLLWIARRHGARVFAPALTLIVFSFLWSYLFYVLLPARGPQVYFPRQGPPHGLWLASELDRWILAAEANKWDLFPSGHTWVTLVTLVLAWRHVRACFWLLLPIGTLLIVATMALNLHFVIDVLAGAAMAAATLALGPVVLRGAPPVTPPGT